MNNLPLDIFAVALKGPTSFTALIFADKRLRLPSLSAKSSCLDPLPCESAGVAVGAALSELPVYRTLLESKLSALDSYSKIEYGYFPSFLRFMRPNQQLELLADAPLARLRRDRTTAQMDWKQHRFARKLPLIFRETSDLREPFLGAVLFLVLVAPEKGIGRTASPL